MSNDREFRIKIKAESDTAPLDNLSEKTRAYIAQLKQGSAEAGHFELRHRELREIINHLSREVPELGLVARYALSPWVASFGLAVFALDQVAEHYKKLAETIRTRVDVRPLQDLIDLVGPQGLVKAFDEAGFAAEDFVRELEKIAGAQRGVKAATDDTIASIHAAIDAYKQERAAIAEREIARIHADEGTGKITHAQAIIAETQVRRGQGDMDRATADELEKKIISAKQSERDTLQKHLDEANIALQPNSPAARESRLAGLKVAQDTAKAAADEAQKQMDAAKDHYLKYGLHPGEEFGMDYGRFKIASHQNDNAQRAADEAAHSYEEAKKADDEFNKGLIETAQQLKALDEEIPKLIQQHTAGGESRAFIGQAQHETSDFDTISRLGGTPEGGYVNRAAHIQQALDAHRQISEDDAGFYKQFLAIMQTNGAVKGQSQAQIIQALEAIGGTQSSSTRRLEALTREAALLQDRLEHLGIHNPP